MKWNFPRSYTSAVPRRYLIKDLCTKLSEHRRWWKLREKVCRLSGKLLEQQVRGMRKNFPQTFPWSESADIRFPFPNNVIRFSHQIILTLFTHEMKETFSLFLSFRIQCWGSMRMWKDAEEGWNVIKNQ